MAKKNKTRSVIDKLPDRIRLLRKQRRLTQEGLCEAAGLSLDAVTRIEQGSRVPTIPTLEKLAGALEVGLAHLVGEKAPPPPKLPAPLYQIMTILKGRPASVQRSALGLVKILIKAVDEG